MKKRLLAAATTAAVAVLPTLAQAQATPAAPAAPTPDWTVTGNASLVSDYRFRGISQTNKKPAFQGGIDVGHKSGFYVGNWNSNVDSGLYNGANLEMDFYGGFKGTTGDFSWDVGLLYYYYPGSGDSSIPTTQKIDNSEVYVSAGWGPVSLKYSYAFSDFFGVPDSKGAYYLDASLSMPAGPVTLVGHVGYQGSLKNGARIVEIDGSGPHENITDWKLGVTYDASGWVLGAAYIGTNRNYTAGTAFLKTRNITDDTLVLSVSKSF
jgi:uncharacterized protein (TIGR02001 family)